MRPNERRAILIKLTLLSVGCLLFAGSLFAQDVFLSAQATSKMMPDGKSVQMWGYALCNSNGRPGRPDLWTCGPATAPGPQLEVTGSGPLVIHLSNTLPVPVSFMLPSQSGGVTRADQGQLGNPDNSGGRMISMVPVTPAFVAPSTFGLHVYTYSNLKAGTYLYESGTMPSVQVPMGLYGALVVKPSANQAYAGVADSTFNAERVLLFSELDRDQNEAVANAGANTAAYPHTVDYSPKYFMINGAAFDSSAVGNSTFDIGTPPAGASQWTVLLRLLNAGSQTRAVLPLGLPIKLLAEDGNVYPDRKRQADVLLSAGKALDVVVTPAPDSQGHFDATYAVFDRFMGLTIGTFESIGGIATRPKPDSGMLAYLRIGNGSAPAPVGSGPRAENDAFSVPKNGTLTCSSPLGSACNILSNDTGVTAAQLIAPPQNGTVELHADGTYVYTPNAHFAGDDTFTYASASGNSNAAIVVMSVAFTNEAPVAAADGYSNNLGSQLKVAKPGVLGNDTDYDGDTLTAEAEGTLPGSLMLNADGSFTYSGSVSTSFQYRARDSHGNASDPVTVTLDMRPASNLTLTVRDPGGASITDYRWLIEEDRTIHHEGFSANGASLGTTFHASYMPVVAQGCVGPSCAEVVPIGDVVLDPNKYYFVSVLPNDAGNGGGDPQANPPVAAGHTVGGSPLKPGQTSVSVLVNNQAIKTAQISVLIFEDNGPINGIQDGNEQGLGGFQITLVEAGGRYGQNGGQMSQDAFGNPLRNALPCAPSQPAGVILTCADGTALIENLAPGKYTISADPPGSSKERWVQTSTIEGTRGQDAWVKSGEPSFFQEFGPPGYHVFIGFVSPNRMPTLNGSTTVQGNVTNMHMSRPPDQSLYDSGKYDALAFTTCWVALNSGTQGIAMSKCNADGHFELAGIPNGTYDLVVWDQWLDQIIATRSVTVPSGANMGNVPVFSWFSRVENYMFIDSNGNGTWDADERPLPNAPITVRFRDGSWYQGSTMDNSGYYSFDEMFPFFNWMTIEADPGFSKTTGLTVRVDGGGPTDADGILSPTYPDGTDTTRIESGPVRTQAFQGFIGQTAQLTWGRKPFEPGENGGISGMISYAATRSEDDVRMAAINTWEPNVPNVKVRLYKKIKTEAGDGLVFVRETTSSSWDSTPPTGCLGQDSTDEFYKQSLQAVGYPIDHCYDGMHNWNQVRPGVYDGRYSFTGIPAGTYVVEVLVPPGYELVKEEDKNVFTGDAYIAAVGVVDPVFGQVDVLPSQSFVIAANAPTAGVAYPPCVGDSREVPQFLSLFPTSEAPFAGSMRSLCDRKEVTLTDQAQGLADFHIFTSVPIAGHFTGMILDDLSQEFNPASPNFGEKWAPAFVPVSIRDFNGVEIGRVYSDQWGMFNGLLPSTYNANVPLPSGYSPAMYTTCMNDPGPITLPNGSRGIDPQYNPMYSNFCYTMQYMPGTTTYLDTPVVPTAAFASGYNPVDCAYPAGTPAIQQVDGDGVGPWLSPGGARRLTIRSQGTKLVPNPDYAGPAKLGDPATQKMITRDFGFGSTPGTVRLGGTALTISAGDWTDAQIVATVPAGVNTGELVVTRGDNGKSTVAGITVTIEDTVPVRVSSGQSIQAAIDGAAPGSLVLVGPGQYEELVIMWKPIRLQGAGAGSTLINAAKFPSEKLNAWRNKVQGLVDSQIVDLLPGQNGVDGAPLIGPGLLGEEEGAGVTVLGKADPSRTNPGPNSYRYLPSSIDGFSITGGDSGGGIFVNGYAHGLQIANNSVYGNSGFYHGGIRVGHPVLEDLAGTGPFDFNSNVNIHHNSITTNGSVSEGSAGGGVSLCTGTDNYHVNYNFICGNFSNGHGGGLGHFGLSNGGEILNNQIVFNQSFSQGTNQSGGGIFIGGSSPVGGGLTWGAGDVTIDGNLIQGNHAGAGHGGGIRLQQFNGQDVQRSNNANNWWRATITNNMIVNNVAGWSGGGISLQDTATSTISNNTIVHNDSTSTVGSTFTAGPTTSVKNPAGISSERHSQALVGAFGGAGNQNLRVFSNPKLTNNIVWENRSFNYDAPNGNASLYPQVSSPGGVCGSGAYYWDLGLLGDTSPTPGAQRLVPRYSILTNTGGYAGANLHNSAANPALVSAYCNGPRSSRNIDEVTNLQPIPALDEGGNWIDVRWGPLVLQGDYHVNAGSPAGDNGTTADTNHDYDGQSRPMGSGVDIGADELNGAPAVPKIAVSDASVAFGTIRVPALAAARQVTVQNSGNAALQIASISVSPSPFDRPNLLGGTCTDGGSLDPSATCTINLTFVPTGFGQFTGSLVIASNDPATPSLNVPLSGNAYQIDRTPTTLNFALGAGTGQTQTLTVQNWGNGAIALAPQITGADAASFAILTTGTNRCGSTIAGAFIRGLAPRMCNIYVRFTSTTNTPVGGANATLNLGSSDTQAQQQVALHGTKP